MSGTLSLVGWWFLPGLVASWTQSIYYSLTIRAGDPRPAPGTRTHALHRRRIQILVITLYLLYTLYEADYDLRRAGNFYTDLALDPSATEREIKSRFRRLAAVHHPDKTQTDGAEFMRLKAAADTLTSDASRFAYERFGPDVAGWKGCASRYEYVFRGTAQGVLPHYIAYAAAHYGMGLLGYLDFARYWRWYALAAMAVLELHAATRPSSALLDALNPLLAAVGHPPLLPFQLVELARRCCVTLYIALSQIGPLLYPKPEGARGGEDDEGALLAQLDKMAAAAADADMSASRLLDVQLAPYRGDDGLMAQVRGRISEWLVQNTIRADPMVKDAMGTTLRKRRVDAPAGARGNR